MAVQGAVGSMPPNLQKYRGRVMSSRRDNTSIKNHLVLSDRIGSDRTRWKNRDAFLYNFLISDRSESTTNRRDVLKMKLEIERKIYKGKAIRSTRIELIELRVSALIELILY